MIKEGGVSCLPEKKIKISTELENIGKLSAEKKTYISSETVIGLIL